MTPSVPVRFCTGTTPHDIHQYRRWLAIAEDTGFDVLTTGDSQSLWAECFAMQTLAAELTSRPDIAVTVANPMTRHPAVAASAAATIQQLSGGRFKLGLSSGDSALRTIGSRPARVAEVESYALAIRDATAGRTATWGGHEFSLHWLDDPQPVPIWIAAEGPRTQRLAGRIADAVILSNCLTPERLTAALENVAAGAAEVGRAPDEIECWCMANVVFADSEDEGIDSIASEIAGSANHVFRFTLDGKGLPDELKPRIASLMAEYDSRHHAHPSASNPNRELIEKYGLRDYLARLGTIAGPPDHCARRIRDVANFGVTNLVVSQFVGDQFEWMRIFGEEVIPAVRAGRSVSRSAGQSDVGQVPSDLERSMS
jgi:5,10-methylenetetrahydromethanopterin reductase